MDGLKRPQSSEPVLHPFVFNSTYPSESPSFDFSLTQITAKVVWLTFGKVRISVKNLKCVFLVRHSCLLSMSENDIERPLIGHGVAFLSLGIVCLPCLLEMKFKVVADNATDAAVGQADGFTFH